MRVVVTAIGSRGDIQPMLAIAKGLRDTGHDVCVATHLPYQETARALNCRFRPIQVNPEATLQQLTERGTLEANPIRALVDVIRLFRPLLAGLGDDLVAVSQNAELVTVSLIGLAFLSTLTELLGTQAVPLLLQPTHPTRAFPNPFFATPRPLQRFKLLNRLTWLTTQNPLVNAVILGAVNAWRRKRFNLPPAVAPFSVIRQFGIPVLYGYSASVVAKPSDWAENFYITGYWYLDRNAQWQPPAELLDFLEAGSPPVYVGFGSMRSRRSMKTAQVLMTAIQRSGQRAIVAEGWGGLRVAELPPNVLALSEAPHDWLFPQVSAVIHHGGAGTTGAGLRAGIPSILTPFVGDQLFLGQRIFELGVGPAPIPNSQLTSKRLAKAIEQVVSDPKMRQRAAELGENIRTEDGVGTAIALMQKHFGAGYR